MPMRFDGGYPWWTFPPEKIAHFTITGRQECADCGGKCCRPERNVLIAPADPSIQWTRAKALARVAKEGDQFILGRRRIVDGQPRWRFRCKLADNGGCTENERPLFCRNYPMNQLAESIAHREPYRRNHWCRLARNLWDEWLANTKCEEA